jgi:hypothetical protein
VPRPCRARAAQDAALHALMRVFHGAFEFDALALISKNMRFSCAWSAVCSSSSSARRVRGISSVGAATSAC